MAVKSHYYSQHAVALRAELAAPSRASRCVSCTGRTPLRHFAVAARQFAILALATWG